MDQQKFQEKLWPLIDKSVIPGNGKITAKEITEPALGSCSWIHVDVSGLCKAVQGFHQDLTCCAQTPPFPSNAQVLRWSLINILGSFLQWGKIIPTLSQIITLWWVSKEVSWAFSVCVMANQESISDASAQTDVCPANWTLKRSSFWRLIVWLGNNSSQKMNTKTLESCALRFSGTKPRMAEILWVVLVNMGVCVVSECFLYLQIFTWTFCANSVYENSARFFQSVFLAHCFLLPVLAYVSCSVIRIPSDNSNPTMKSRYSDYVSRKCLF